jgi:hypothetical protein
VRLRENLALRLNARQNLTAFESMVEGEDDKLRGHLLLSAGVSYRRPMR